MPDRTRADAGEPAGASAEIVAVEGAACFVVRTGGRDQSYVDLDDPARLVFDYVRRMGDVVDAAAPSGEPLRVVHVGGAGLTLPRYLCATRPTSAQVVLEPDTELTELVRARLPLPRRSGVKVRPVDGRSGLAQLREGGLDLVVLDAFDRDGRVPLDLLTLEAFAEMARVLGPAGLVLVNLVDRAPFREARAVVAGIGASFDRVLLSAEPATMRGRRAGNLLLVAGRDGVPLAALRRSASSSAAPYRVLDERGVSDHVGGGTAHRDRPRGVVT